MWLAQGSEASLPGGIWAPTPARDITLAIGLPAKDCCVVVADSLAILDDATSRDGESKIRQIGGNCVVGLSGHASMALGILAATGCYDRRGMMDVAVEAERVACAFRLYRVGNTTEASWREKERSRDVVLQSVACRKPPFIGGLPAGFTGRDLATPAVYSIKRDEALSTFMPEHPVAMGGSRFSVPILNEHYTRPIGTHQGIACAPWGSLHPGSGHLGPYGELEHQGCIRLSRCRTAHPRQRPCRVRKTHAEAHLTMVSLYPCRNGVRQLARTGLTIASRLLRCDPRNANSSRYSCRRLADTRW